MRKSEEKTKVKLRPSVVIKRVVLCFFTTIIILVAGVFGATTILCYGPSNQARDIFVKSVLESSAAKFMAHIYFSDDEIKAIQESNKIEGTDEKTDESLIQVGDDTTDNQFDKKKIELVDIKGHNYKGKLLIVNDPKRVFIGTVPEFGKDKEGMRVIDMVKANNCIAGINGGGFDDPAGIGKGGAPLGIVISQGKLLWGSRNNVLDICGFDKDGRLHVGKMSGQEALDKNIVEALFYGPTLIVNGEPVDVKGNSSGWNPRTAIGQRADGAVLLLVIDGRQSDSIGATYSDIIQEMLKYGAINAYNLDGGTSSHLVYKGEIVTSCSSLYGTRKLPTSVLVRGDE